MFVCNPSMLPATEGWMRMKRVGNTRKPLRKSAAICLSMLLWMGTERHGMTAEHPNEQPIGRIELVRELPGTQGAWGVAWDDKYKRLAVSLNMGQAFKVFDKDFNQISSFEAPYGAYNGSMGFTAEGLLITPTNILGSKDDAMSLWDPVTGNWQGNIPGSMPGEGVLLNRATTISVSASRKLAVGFCLNIFHEVTSVYDLKKRKSLFKLSNDILGQKGEDQTAASISPDGNRVAIATSMGRVVIYSINERKILNSYVVFSENKNGVYDTISFSKGKEKISLGSGMSIENENGSFFLAKVLIDNFKKIVSTYTKTNPLHAMSWSPSGKYLALSSSEGSLVIWDVEKGPNARVSYNGSGTSVSIAWLDDDYHLAAASSKSSVQVLTFTN